MNFILASGSPRRKELMEMLGVKNLKIIPAKGEEKPQDGASPEDLVMALAAAKAEEVAAQAGEDDVVVAADTIVWLDGRPFGKPHSREEAVRMLSMLSGREHEVITGVTVRDCCREETFSDVTYVTFKTFTAEEIDYYVDTCKPYDKAGAYGIQEWIGYIGTTDMRGSFYNVMGFPVHRVYRELQCFL